MIDALDALKLIRTQGMRPAATRLGSARAATQPLINLFQSAPGPKMDQFQQQVSGLAKQGRFGQKAIAQPEAHKPALLGKPAPSGGMGGLFQTLKSKWFGSTVPAPVQNSLLHPMKKLQQAIEAQKMDLAETVPKPSAIAPVNPFRTVEAILLHPQQTEVMASKAPALVSQSLSGTALDTGRKLVNRATDATMSIAGMALLAAPIAAPAAAVSQVNPFVLKLAAFIP